MNPSGSTRVFAILGEPVTHSLSPAMHNAAFRVLGLDAAYLPLRCRAERVPDLMRALAEAGGGGNVTIPHKGRAAAACDRMQGPLAGTCNTFWSEGDALVGDNTDVAGVLDGLAAIGAPATRWMVIGTGGSCQAVLAAARERGAAVALRSRSAERQKEAMDRLAGLGITEAEPDGCEVLINTTPLGLRTDDPLPVTPYEECGARWVLDLVYAPNETPFVRAFRERGATAADGRGVLVAQGAAALERWFPVRAPRDAMLAAVRAALA